MVLMYVDDCILISKDVPVINEFTTSLIDEPKKCVFTNEGTLTTCLGVGIPHLSTKEGFILPKPHLIGCMIKALHFDPKTTKGALGNTPVAHPLLSKDTNGPHRKALWKCWSLVGMHGYLQGTSCPVTNMPIHRCTRSNIDQRLSNEKDVKKKLDAISSTPRTSE